MRNSLQSRTVGGGAENAGPENAGPENAGQNAFSGISSFLVPHLQVLYFQSTRQCQGD